MRWYLSSGMGGRNRGSSGLVRSRRGFGQVQVPYERCLGGERGVPIALRIVEELPGQNRQFGRPDAKFQAQTPVLPPRLPQAHLVAGADLTREERLEEAPAEVLDGLFLGRSYPPPRPAGPEQGNLQRLEPVAQFPLVEGELHLPQRLPSRRTDGDGILPRAALADL